VERGEKREEVDDNAEGREQAVSQSCDVRSCLGGLEVDLGHYFLGYVALGEAMKSGAVVLVLGHQEDIE
jgi:hypothetical protein